MSWKAYLVETTSGIASRALEVSAFDWEDELNIMSGGKATIQKESLAGLARPQYDVYQASLVLCYVRPDGEEVPWVGGPITGRPTETLETLEMTWGGIRAILARRLALREDAVADAQAKLAALIQVRKDVEALELRLRNAEKALQTAKQKKVGVTAAENEVKDAENDLAAKTAEAEALEADTEEDFNVTFRNSSLGGIAWGLVQLAQLKPGGRLPIVRGTRAEAGGYSRTYPWYDLANLNVDRLLTEISEMEDGPDIHFRPRWADRNQTRFEWVMVHGTNAQPVIAQEWSPDWDTTAEANDVVDITVSNDASAVTDRIYVTGTGSGAGVLVSQATNLARVQTGRPFLEAVASDSNQSDINVLRQRAHGRLASTREPLDQVTLTVRADSDKNLLGRWRVGDAATVTIGEGWVHIPAGTYLMRVIKASGDLTENVTLEMQEDQWYPGGM